MENQCTSESPTLLNENLTNIRWTIAQLCAGSNRVLVDLRIGDLQTRVTATGKSKTRWSTVEIF